MAEHQEIYSPISLEKAKNNIGKLCKKGSISNIDDWKTKRSIKNRAKRNRKFQSGCFVNTIKDVTIHPFLNIPAYTFIEDDSYVECRRCKIINKFECTITQLASLFDELMIEKNAEGFSIGKGKKIYWYISPSPLGFYYAYPQEPNGILGWRRQLKVNDKITIHYK